MNIDYLRWIIAGCGLVLIAGIYLRERFRRNAMDDEEKDAPPGPDLPSEAFSLKARNSDRDEELELPSMRGERFDKLPEEAIVSEADPETLETSDSKDSVSEDPFGIIQIKVSAHEGMCFSGTLLIEALRAVGLEYGSMKIFHKQPDGARMPLFSVVNMVEPGSFPVDDPSHFESPGVVFFLQLAASEQPVAAYDEMVRTAHILASRIGGEVLDQENELLTVEKTEATRDSLTPVSG